MGMTLGSVAGMRGRAALLVLAATVPFPSAIAAADAGATGKVVDRVDGFRDVRFGMGVGDKVFRGADQEFVHEKKHETQYSRPRELRKLGGVPLDRVWYRFFRDRLVEVTILVAPVLKPGADPMDGESAVNKQASGRRQEAVLKVLRDMYGPADSVEKDRADGYASLFDSHHWEGEKVDVMAEVWRTGPQAGGVFITITSIPLIGEMQEDRLRESEGESERK
jgi:hypothetical protein